ncbi:MAG: hypothetical protein KBC35_03470 [Candidatus Pacebacteria bacterium]|nr:hypothetical protein [Candidatus Paceibacterota bacterium]
MKNTSNLLLTQNTLLFAGTVFAWFTVYNDFAAFFSTYDSLLRFADCTPPNPLSQTCFYGAFAFLIALTWSFHLYQGRAANLQDSQRKLLYLLTASTSFAWSSFSYMLYSYHTATSNPFTCVLGAETNIFTTPCFIGSVFFTLSLLAGIATYRALRQ